MDGRGERRRGPSSSLVGPNILWGKDAVSVTELQVRKATSRLHAD